MTDTDAQFQEIIKEVHKMEEAEKQKTTPPTPAPETATVTETTTVEQTSVSTTPEIIYPHITIMQEEGLKKEDLPKNIRDMINTFNRKLATSKRNNAPEETFLKIQNLSTLIADKIMDFLEKNIPQNQPTMTQKQTPPPANSTPKPVKKEDGGAAEINDIPEPQNSSEDIDDTPAETPSTQTETPPAETETPPSDDDKKEDDDEGIFGGILGGIFNWS